MTDFSNRAEIVRFAKNSRETIIIAFDRYRDVDLLDVRVFTGDDAEQATKKGISFRVDKLPDLIGALMQAEREARARGLLLG